MTPGHGSYATDVDDRGTIVGNVSLPGGTSRAFVLPRGASGIELLPVPAGHDGHSVAAAAINERGTIVGVLQVAGDVDVDSLGLVWQGRNHRVSVLPGTGRAVYVGDVNDRGTIVGATLVGDPDGAHLRALRWTDAARPPEEIGTPGTDSIARGVNERGVVVGIQFRAGIAFQWDPRTGRTTELPDLGDGASDAWEVNDRGVAVGNSAVSITGANTATVFGRP